MQIKKQILTKDALIKAIEQGLTPKYVFFWSHEASNSILGKNCFSQWYRAPFEVEGIIYPSAEHYLMAEKARLFQDKFIFKKILNSLHPGEAKKLGRKIKNFDEQIWQSHRFDIAIKGNMAKFQQNNELGDFLSTTQHRVLVESSPVDKIWGIGLSQEHPDVYHPKFWPGLNLLGFVLMKVREDLIGSQ